MFRDYIELNGLRYKVKDTGDPVLDIVDRQKTTDIGLTGLTIIQDFTVSDRVPTHWEWELRVYVDEVPDPAWGNWANLLTAQALSVITMIPHDDTLSHSVTIKSPLSKRARVGAAISGEDTTCYHILWIPVVIEMVYQ
jgi:hypothetical protein